MRHLVLFAMLACSGLAPAQDAPIRINLPVQELILDNGMKVLVVERHDVPRVYCALYWKVGSVNERPGITGVSHFFEHMMFKGTKTIGTTDPKRDAELIGSIEDVMGRMRRLKLAGLEALRLGQPVVQKAAPVTGTIPSGESAAWDKLAEEYQGYADAQKKITIGQHLANLYQAAGGTGLNATTSIDRTNYFVDLPSNKVELFFWIEADRFSGPVFREFYKERENVKEERRLRCDSTPTGLINQDFNAMFWQAFPYSWQTIGWMSDIDNYTMADAQRYFDVYYSPQNCTAVFVGDVKTADIQAMAKRYFGRIKRSPVDPDPVVTIEPAQSGERRMVAEADSNPSIAIQWHAPAQAHKDGTPLDVTLGVLSGRTGRLHRALVEEKKLALGVGAHFGGMKYAGEIEIGVQPRPGAKTEEVEAAIYEIIEKAGREGPTEQELRKVKNQMLGDLVRGLQTNDGIAHALGMSEVLHDWRDVNTNAVEIEKTTAEDVKRLIRTYMTPSGRNVLVIKRREQEKH